MNFRTKKLILLMCGLFTVAALAAGLMLYQIHRHGTQLTAQIEILRERAQKDLVFNRIVSLVTDSAEERASIDSYFFKSEGDSIGFLSDIEQFAREIGLNLETKSLDKITATDKTEQIKISFSYSGPEAIVLGFTELLENLPYHSIVQSLQLRNEAEQSWSGQVTLLITIQPPNI